MTKTSKGLPQGLPVPEKPLTIIVTVMPPKRGLRTMIVSAAREGEMPLVLGGTFADRHALLDKAYGAVLKRDPPVVTIKEAKPGKAKSITDDEEEEPGNREPDGDAEQGDQLVEEAPIPNPSPVSADAATGEGSEELPAIEGDEVVIAERISDISLPAGFPLEARGAKRPTAARTLANDEEAVEVDDGEQD